MKWLAALSPKASVNLSTGLFCHEVMLDYSARKGAIRTFTKSLATNLALRGIPRQCSRAGASVDAAEPGRPGAGKNRPVRRWHRYETPCAAKGSVARLCVFGFTGELRIHHRYRAAGNGWCYKQFWLTERSHKLHEAVILGKGGRDQSGFEDELRRVSF